MTKPDSPQQGPPCFEANHLPHGSCYCPRDYKHHNCKLLGFISQEFLKNRFEKNFDISIILGNCTSNQFYLLTIWSHTCNRSIQLRSLYMHKDVFQWKLRHFQDLLLFLSKCCFLPIFDFGLFLYLVFHRYDSTLNTPSFFCSVVYLKFWTTYKIPYITFVCLFILTALLRLQK